MLLLVFFFAYAIAGTEFYHKNIYDTVQIGTYVIDEILDVPMCGCANNNKLSVPNDCGPNFEDSINSCSRNITFSGKTLNTTGLYSIDYEFITYIQEFGGIPPTFDQLYNTYVVSTSYDDHPFITIQYDGNDYSSCLKGPTGTNPGLGGIDLSQGGTQNSIVLSIFTELDLTIDVTIYDTDGNFERVRHVVPMTKSGSHEPWQIGTFNSFSLDEYYSAVVFTNTTILSNVDALVIRIYDNPSSYTPSPDFAIRKTINTGFVTGCRFLQDHVGPEYMYDREVGSSCELPPAGGYPIPTYHESSITCPVDVNGDYKPFITFVDDGPFTYDKYVYNNLPFGNTFSYNDLTVNYTNIASPASGVVLTKFKYIGDDIYMPTPYDVGGRISTAFNQLGGVSDPAFPIPGYGLIQLDWAHNQPKDQLFDSYTVTVGYLKVFSSSSICTGPNAIGPTFTPLDVNLNPLTAPISSTLLLTANGDYIADVTYTAGSNVIRGVLIDWGTFECVTYDLPYGFGVFDFSIPQFELTSSNLCTPPSSNSECRTLTGNAYIDEGAGNYTYFDVGSIVTVRDGDKTEYFTISNFNGTFQTLCYDVGTTLEIEVIEPTGTNTQLMNNPQNYTVLAQCQNIIPSFIFDRRRGVFF